VTPDGVIGPQTLAAVQAAHAPGLIQKIYSRRWLAYRQASGFETFGDGWLARLDKVKAQALAMAAGEAVA
jgi:lysozyme family protein